MLEHIVERATTKENGRSNGSGQYDAINDGNSSSTKTSTSSKGLTFVEDISKSVYVKQAK